jgi:hypothetical protein
MNHSLIISPFPYFVKKIEVKNNIAVISLSLYIVDCSVLLHENHGVYTQTMTGTDL